MFASQKLSSSRYSCVNFFCRQTDQVKQENTIKTLMLANAKRGATYYRISSWSGLVAE